MERSKEETRRAKEMSAKVRAVLERLAVEEKDGEVTVEREQDEQVDDDRERMVWEIVGREVGFA